MKFRLTRTGGLVLALGVAFYFAAITSQSGLLLLLVGLAVGCLGANCFLSWQSLKSLDIQVPGVVHLSEGERLAQPWRVMNRGTRASGLIRAESNAGVLFGIRVIPGGGEASVVPELKFEKRGVYSHSEVRLVSDYPFGLARWERRLQIPGEVIVSSAVYHCPPPPASGYDVMLGGKFKGHHPVASGAHFAGVRPFREGDSFKQIHWKSSAKGQGLMVKTFEEELSGRVSFLIDNGWNPDSLDDCARAAGSLMFAALDAGHHVEALDLARMEPLLVPPFADGQEILEWLARLPQTAAETDDSDPVECALELFSRKSAICFVFTRWNPAIGQLLGNLAQHRRRVSVCLPIAAATPGLPVGIRMLGYKKGEIVERP